MVLDVMRSNTIKQIPIVDDNGRVSGLHSLDDFLARPEISNLMIIMAGRVSECCIILMKIPPVAKNRQQAVRAYHHSCGKRGL